jgi:hypothetical protein
MINLPSLLVSEKLQANKANYPTFKVLIEEHAASKGLSGYLDGIITKPPIITVHPGTTATAPDTPTPIFSTTPSCDEWTYRDGVLKSMIITNVLDSIGLGLKCDGTATECWDSVTAVCAKKSDAALSLAQSELQSIKFDGSSRDDLDALLSNICNKGNVVRMMGGTVVDKDLENVLIRSLPADPCWSGLQGALFATVDLDDAFAAHQDGGDQHRNARAQHRCYLTYRPQHICP